MEAFELILILLACVIVSAVLDQVLSRISLPLIQIAVGFVIALILPEVADVHVESELFLVLFIAPLLFNEARHANRKALATNLGSIVSLAIGLVLAIVLVAGFALHLMVPSIPLAAAFACAAALGPTDAAAVAALGSTVRLGERQETLLSGESLINDASGVVSFQFAIAAAVTGAFSAVEAGTEFAVLFFGGIAAGLVMGIMAIACIRFVRRRGFESTTVHVIYEVFTPFVVFLAAEAMGVSGILAVVAAGLVMVEPAQLLSSTSAARHRLVSRSVWEVIVFLINGVIFVLLGMQLPHAMNPDVLGGLSTGRVILYVLGLTALVEVVRFVWVGVMELLHRDEQTGERGSENPRAALKRALVTTIAGAKGAVTLSIIFTIPLTLADGSAFPSRSLIIFLTAGVILCTLLLADTVLPLLSRGAAAEGADEALGGEDAEKDDLAAASIAVLNGVIGELMDKISSGTRPELEPATRTVIGQYQVRAVRVAHEGISDEVLGRLRAQVLEHQRAYVEDAARATGCTQQTTTRYDALLDRMGHMLGADVAPARGRGRTALRSFTRRVRLWIGSLKFSVRRLTASEEQKQQDRKHYAETVALGIELERAAIDCLTGVRDDVAATDETRRAARLLLDEHQTALDLLLADDTAENLAAEARGEIAVGSRPNQMDQLKEHLHDVQARAYSIELDQIRRLHEDGQISGRVARLLREDVYVMQMGLAGGAE